MRIGIDQTPCEDTGGTISAGGRRQSLTNMARIYDVEVYGAPVRPPSRTQTPPRLTPSRLCFSRGFTGSKQVVPAMPGQLVNAALHRPVLASHWR